MKWSTVGGVREHGALFASKTLVRTCLKHWNQKLQYVNAGGVLSIDLLGACWSVTSTPTNAANTGLTTGTRKRKFAMFLHTRLISPRHDVTWQDSSFRHRPHPSTHSFMVHCYLNRLRALQLFIDGPLRQCSSPHPKIRCLWGPKFSSAGAQAIRQSLKPSAKTVADMIWHATQKVMELEITDFLKVDFPWRTGAKETSHVIYIDLHENFRI